MRIMLLAAIVALLAILAKVIIYFRGVGKVFENAGLGKVPEDGSFVFHIEGKDKEFQYSVPVEEYERSKEEPVPVKGTEGIYLYRGRVYEKLQYALDEMAKRSGREIAESFLERERLNKGA